MPLERLRKSGESSSSSKQRFKPDPRNDEYCLNCGRIFYNCVCSHDDEERFKNLLKEINLN